MKKIISMLLVCLMVLQMCPMGIHTHAEELETEPVIAAEAVETTEVPIQTEAPTETAAPAVIPETVPETVQEETAAPTEPRETEPEETVPAETTAEETVGEEILLPEDFAWIELEEAASAKTYYESEPNNTIYQADYFEVTYDVAGTLSGQDLDYFVFQLDAKSKISIIAVATKKSFAMALMDSSGEILLKDIEGTKNDSDYYTYKIAGTYSAGTYAILTMDGAQNKTTYIFGMLVDPLYETCKHSKKKKVEVVEATCGQDGYTAYYCPTCETSWKTNVVPATGNHTYYDQYDSICDVCRGNRYLGVARGECGDPMNWVIYDDGRMVVSGWGDMQLNNGNGMPWDSHKSKIKRLEVKDEVFRISDHAFEDCTNLTSITLAGSVLNIENGAFRNCTSLSSVTLGEGVRRIGDETFGSCTALTSIRIPSTLTEIDSGAFVLCDNLASIHVASGNTVYSSCDGVLYNADKTTLQFVPMGITGTVTIPGSVTQFSGNFNGRSRLTGVVVSEGVTIIPQSYFENCTSLKNVSLPKSLTMIYAFAFSNCTSLTSIVIPEKITNMPNHGFYNCTSLTSVTMPDAAVRIESGCFAGCTALKNVILPPKLEMIDQGAFSGCTSLASITFPKSITEIGYNAFNDCAKLTEITFEGDAPAMLGCFNGVTATAYYPITNTTWTDDVRQNYGGTLTWIGKCISGHLEVIDKPGVAPTCTEEGLSPDSHCSNCGEITSVQQVVPALGHDVITDEYLAPTCVDTGLTEGSHCGRCAEVLLAQEVIPALGHDTVVDAYLAPTCEETGLTEGSHCGRCEWVFVAQNVIPALGHSYTDHWCDNCGRAEFVEVISIETDAQLITNGQQANLTAVLDYPIRKETEIIWTLEADGGEYATLEADRDTAVLTANRLLEDAVVTVTARTADGLHDPVSIHITIRGVDSDHDLFAGKSLTLKPINPETSKAYTAKQLTWTLEERYEPFATVKNGKVTAQKVVQKERIQVVATDVATGEKIPYVIDIYPTITQLEVKREEEIVNGKTILLDYAHGALILKTEAFPTDTLAKVTWTVSDKKGQYADYAIDGDTLTISNPKGQSGTVTIKATADAGVKKTVTVKVQFGTYAREVTIFEPASTTLRGGESLTLSAYISDPVVVTKPGIVWSVSDKNAATVSNGKVKAKNVAHPTEVTITATSKDGQASASIDLTILPKNEGQLVLTDGKQFISGTKAMNFGDILQLSACTVKNGETVPVAASWTTSNGAVAYVEEGLITATGVGTAKVTAEYGEQKVVLTVKVATLVGAMEITTKDGKNIIDENGETMVILSSGKAVNLVANILTAGANKTVTWEIVDGGEYAKIASSGKLTANKDLTSVQYVTVKATAKDGSGTSTAIRVKVVPLATGIQLYRNGSRVCSNTILTCDMLVTPSIKLSARVYPAKANQAVELTSSNKKIADFVDGELKCYKAGTVTITAKALDGSNVKTTFKLTIVKKITELKLNPSVPVDENGNLFVAGGKSLKLAPMVEITPSDATNKKLNWSVAPNDYGIKINASGVLSTKKVSQPVTVNIMVTTQDGNGAMLSFDVLVYPA